MQLPSANITHLKSQYESIARQLLPAYAGANNTVDDAKPMVDSLEKLTAILTSTGQDHALEEKEVTELGDYGMQILGQCSKLAVENNNTELQQEIGLMSVSVALWVSEHGGSLSSLEPVVDTIAWLANQIQDQKELAVLSDSIGLIISACSLAISSDLDNMNPGRPWRVININRGIVATRSHNPEIMDAAFRTLIKNLPQDAPNFFAEGMSEMERLGYPEHVRKVMTRYYEQWNEPHTIH